MYLKLSKISCIKYFIIFLREAEWKISNTHKIYDEIIQEFFDCFKYFENFSVFELYNNFFINNGDVEKEEN